MNRTDNSVSDTYFRYSDDGDTVDNYNQYNRTWGDCTEGTFP